MGLQVQDDSTADRWINVGQIVGAPALDIIWWLQELITFPGVAYTIVFLSLGPNAAQPGITRRLSGNGPKVAKFLDR